jgi:hypothetical protein
MLADVGHLVMAIRRDIGNELPLADGALLAVTADSMKVAWLDSAAGTIDPSLVHS